MTVLGMNRRNALIMSHNSRAAIMAVNQKFQTKKRLAALGVPVPETLALIEDEVQLAEFDFATLPDAFAVKPNRGRRGEGVILVDGRNAKGWRKLNGETLTPRMLREHVNCIMRGELSLEGANADAALFEPLIRTHPDFARLVPFGLPDLRIICLGDVPLMAMTRLPTTESRGRANLHQGAVGAAIDFRTGAIFRAVLGTEEIEYHPSTGECLIGEPIPMWDDAVRAAKRCSAALDLGYVGVDIVIDAERGAQVLECNAFPGLEIQNVNGAGLAWRLDMAQRNLKRRQTRSQMRSQTRTTFSVDRIIRRAATQIVESWMPPGLAA
ncbi:sugar-transfer associated ATP-grasp domain-containing protein [Qipengyuania sp. ASV99]|uniref:sugar-transfer associated ATP-grasp domain-containing protein n=1 Tax=Qipengyuania sp. ASV99 TaxID=3399681 RepID=UPI003A4C8455